MKQKFDPAANYEASRQIVGYIPRKQATRETYDQLGFMCGLEIHQQLLTERKLFCRCPAGLYQRGDDFDQEIIRHMRPTLSELGEYDGTALMEFKTKKNVIYRIKKETACTYDYDDTPPFPVNREALYIALEIALLLKMNIVGELHITRKQYLDGSIPTGFQRTGIVAIEGKIPLRHKSVRIIQLSIEEDACREVSDQGHWRTYTTDRLGMPLMEMVTYPDMKTPDEAAEAAHYLRFLARSSGKVRTGIGAAREDVNVSVTGGTRVEIKGVAHIRLIPELVHNEAFRQWSLLEIRRRLKEKIPDPQQWQPKHREIDFDLLFSDYAPLGLAKADGLGLVAMNLPHFKGILSSFTQPGKMFADELSERVKVIACLERPNLIHSEEFKPVLVEVEFGTLRRLLGSNDDDAQLLIWGPNDDIKTAIETIEERCRLAMAGIPNETRKSFPDGTTIFERVLPGPDRMYPDTDSAPISIPQQLIEEKKKNLPLDVVDRFRQLAEWHVPDDVVPYLLRRNLVGLIERIVQECKQEPRFVATVFGHQLKHIEGKLPLASGFTYKKIYGMFVFANERKIEREILREMVPVVFEHPNMAFESVLITLDYHQHSLEDILSYVPALKRKFREIKKSSSPLAEVDWIMGHLRKRALGNVPLRELRALVEKEVANG
jgi:glutamyl-tRNA(Gln) amidotransferase subunit E